MACERYFSVYKNEWLQKSSANAECAQTPARIMWSRAEAYMIGTNVSVLPCEGKTWVPTKLLLSCRKGHIVNVDIAPI